MDKVWYCISQSICLRQKFHSQFVITKGTINCLHTIKVSQIRQQVCTTQYRKMANRRVLQCHIIIQEADDLDTRLSQVDRIYFAILTSSNNYTLHQLCPLNFSIPIFSALLLISALFRTFSTVR